MEGEYERVSDRARSIVTKLWTYAVEFGTIVHKLAAVETQSVLRSLGASVRELRETRGLSRRELAGRSGLSERFLAQVESGEGNPSVVSLLQIARALGTTGALLLAAPVKRGAIALLGLRGAGKTSIGRALSKKLKLQFVELDHNIEQAAGLSLQEIFVVHGETYYRELEFQAIGRLFPREDPVVIAAGGGIITHRESFDSLREHARTVWLKADPEEHWNRVVAQGDHRPMENDPLAMERLRSLLAAREPLYASADFTVDTTGRTIADVVREICEWARA